MWERLFTTQWWLDSIILVLLLGALQPVFNNLVLRLFSSARPVIGFLASDGWRLFEMTIGWLFILLSGGAGALFLFVGIKHYNTLDRGSLILQFSMSIAFALMFILPFLPRTKNTRNALDDLPRDLGRYIIIAAPIIGALSFLLSMMFPLPSPLRP